MERIYRCILVILMVALIGCGVWYVFSVYNQQKLYEDGVLVKSEQVVELEKKQKEEGNLKDVAGNGIY